MKNLSLLTLTAPLPFLLRQTHRCSTRQFCQSDARVTTDLGLERTHISSSLLTNNAEATSAALKLLSAQLDNIVNVVPPAAVGELRKVPLWFSPEYPGIRPKAEYHASANWLRENGRDPVMAKSVEFYQYPYLSKPKIGVCPLLSAA